MMVLRAGLKRVELQVQRMTISSAFNLKATPTPTYVQYKHVSSLVYISLKVYNAMMLIHKEYTQ